LPIASLSRRTFLQAATAATLATQLKTSSAREHEVYPENGTLIPDEGWRLWVDEHAQWKAGSSATTVRSPDIGGE